MPRKPSHIYLDPLDAIWLTAADRMGFRVARSSEVYAATDGTGVITLGTPKTLDDDDSLAQMLFHEFCHALVQGSQAHKENDWGLDNMSSRDVTNEHACLRLQAHLAGPFGLRRVLAPTTEFRSFYDALPEDPLADASDGTVQAALDGARRTQEAPWAPHLDQALEATAAVIETLRAFGALEPTEERPPIWE